MAGNTNQIQLERILPALFRYQRRAFVFFLSMSVLTVAATALIPRMYKSEAKLFLKLGRENVVLDPTATTGQTVQVSETREREITSVIEMLKGRNLIEQVVDKIGVETILDEPVTRGYGGIFDWSHLTDIVMSQVNSLFADKLPDVPPNSDETESDTDPKAKIVFARRRENAIRALMAAVESSAPRNSNVVSITAKGRSPKFAQRKLEMFLAAYAEQHLRVNRTSGSFEFFAEQAERQRIALEEATTTLRDAKNRVGLVSVESQRTVVEKEMIKLEDTQSEVRSELASSQAKIEGLRKKLSGPPTTAELQTLSGSTADGINRMREQFFKVQVELEALLSRFTIDHPAAVAKNQEVRAAEQLLARHELAVEQSSFVEHSSRLESIKKQYEVAQQRLQQLNEDEVHLTELQRQVDRLEISYKKYLENREQSRIDQALESGRISNVNIAQAPTFIPKPATPQPLQTLMLGFVAAITGAVGLALASEFMDPALKTAAEIENALQLPVLLTVPYRPSKTSANVPTGMKLRE